MTAEQLEELLGNVTQGEWHTDEHLHDAPYQTIKIGPEGNHRVAKVWQDDVAHDYNAEQQANATLISIAPSLARRVIAAEIMGKELDNVVLATDCLWARDKVYNALTAYREASK